MVFGEFVAYRLKFRPGIISLKSCVEYGEPLSSTVERKQRRKNVIPTYC